MRKFMLFILAAALSITMAGTAFAGSMITVSGNGQALVPADTAIISLGASTQDSDVLAAQKQTNETINAIRTALLEYGISAEDINTGYINIYAMYDWNGYVETISAYNASSTLAIRTTDMDKVGEIIDIAFGAGANILNNISFSATDTTKAEEMALKDAVDSAKRKAGILADAAGLTIKGIVSINEGGTYSYDYGVMNNFSRAKEETAADEAGTFVQSAKLTVEANINITFETAE